MTITKELLERAYREYFNKEDFLSVDPCELVYELKRHTTKQLDIELGALFVAMITWGNRKAIKKAALHMLETEMKWNPSEFILKKKYKDCYLDAKNGCVYRTLNREKFILVCENLHNALCEYNLENKNITLESILKNNSVEQAIAVICQWLSPARLGTPGQSACKRICMYLRWMIRKEEPDLGLWHSFSQSDLYAVMDVHVCKLTATLLSRKQADWKSCVELTNLFRNWSADDPLKYDIALMTVADHREFILD